jgi:hypothetical protein
MSQIRSAASAEDVEMRKTPTKIGQLTSELSGIASVKLLSVVKFGMTVAGRVDNDTPKAPHPGLIGQCAREVIGMGAVDKKIQS